MTEPAAILLDDSVLEHLAGLICGDDDRLLYRRAFEIVKFFRSSGWSVPDDLDGAWRRPWTVARLLAGREDGQAMARLVLRLVDRREYLGEEDAHRTVVDRVNSLLAVDGFAVTDTHRRPRLVELVDDNPRPALSEPLELTVRIEDIVSSPEFARQLRGRIDEARRCREAGAPTAAVIMLGSVLEGVLYDVALSRHKVGRAPTDHFESLINLAHESRWVTKDVVDYAHVLRDHRNLVHPKKQWTQAYSPTDKTALIAWNVVVAALSDLAGAT
jgi:hypothetical protein